MAAAKELRTHPDRYAFSDEKEAQTTSKAVSKAGTWAEGRALQALSTAAKLELHIWRRNDQLRKWELYTLTPQGDRGKAKSQQVWLQLAEQHYTYLRPSGTVPAATRKKWNNGARKKFDDPGLSGGGRSIRAAMGLDWMSASACTPPNQPAPPGRVADAHAEPPWASAPNAPAKPPIRPILQQRTPRQQSRRTTRPSSLANAPVVGHRLRPTADNLPIKPFGSTG